MGRCPVTKSKTSILSRISRSCTARGSGTDLCRRGPAKVKALKSILFTEGSPEDQRKSEHLFDKMITLYFISLCFTVLRSSKVSHSIVFHLAMKNMGLCLNIKHIFARG